MKINDYKPLNENAQRLLEQRYLLPGETWPELCTRVVEHVCPEDTDTYKEEVYFDILNRVWLPNSPALVNAGKKNAGLMACFVVGPEEDTLENHFETLSDIAAVAKSGGGCGFTGSNIRPHNSPVAGSSHGYAYGPNKFAGMVSHAMDMMTQSGFRKMALMYTLDCHHPDIEEFIYLKQTTDESSMYNFNQSVWITDDWMRLAQFPDTVEHELFHRICQHSWNNGEPGLLFDSNINSLGMPYFDAGEMINCTNPCSI